MGLKDWTKQDILTLFAVLIAFGSLWVSYFALSNTTKVEVSLNQDLNEIKGKIAEYETISTQNLSSGKMTIDCPDDKEAVLEYDENDMVILCK